NRPCLSDATARGKGSSTVENFNSAAETVVAKLIGKGFEKGSRSNGVVIHTQVRQNKRTKQPAPDCSLMVGSVAFARATSVPVLKMGMAWRQATQPVGGEKVTGAGVHNGALLV